MENKTLPSTVATNDSALTRDKEMLLRTGQVLAKFASTLALRPVNSEIVDKGHPLYNHRAPSWSNNNTLYLHAGRITNLADAESLIALRGLGLHEAAHMMFTPDGKSTYRRDVNKNDWHRASNVLEDQRIEMNLHSMFSNVDDWLTASVAKHVLSIPQEQLQYQLPMVWGRKYLDPEIRKFFYDIYPDVANRDEICALIDEYLPLTINKKNTPQALGIVKRFHDLIADGLQSKQPQTITLPNPQSPTGQSEFTKPGSKDGWNKINDNDHHAHRESDAQSDSSSGVSDKQQSSNAQKIAKAVADDNAMNSTPAQSQQGDSNSPSDAASDDKTPGNSAGEKLGGGIGYGDSKFVQDWANTVQQRIINEQSKVLDTMRKQIRGELSLDGKTIPAPSRRGSNTEPPSLPAVQAVKSFARELEELKAQYDPSWERRVDSGKLNVQRYGSGCEVDEAFDQWDMGREDAVDIECVIALDTSGSMGWTMSAAFQYMWAIKRAMDSVGASTTVVSFDHETKLIYSSDERATHQYKYTGMGGSTDPLHAVEYAKSVLGNSSRAIKVFIPITDGDWYRDTECDELIRIMRKGGVITALAMLNESVYSNHAVNSHGCEVAVSVTNASQLYLLARNMVKVGIKRNLAA